MVHSINLPPLDVTGLLRTHGIKPDKRLGQNFLIDESSLHKVVEAARVTPDDHILEIGPGLGSLTRYLARLAKQVTVVELDKNLIPPLEQVIAPYSNVHIVVGDILALNPSNLMPVSGFLVVANIPYYITSALIRHLLEADLKPKRMVLTVQREVARRITAEPGDMSLLALSVQVYGQAEIAAAIPAGAFYPAPQVDSAVVRVEMYPQPVIPIDQLNVFFRLAKAGFSQKRKTLRNALSGGLAWSPAKTEDLLVSAGIDPGRRAETLSLQEWSRLTSQFISTPDPDEDTTQEPQDRADTDYGA
ncbi:MAG: 16S rRNA (adenine(1518)-N(6)/adenine(1519)-N(6))-dimethyltransferase RsmA [Omnitrophica WOR_2 bacterium]